MIPRKPSKGDPPDLSSQTSSQHIDAVEDLRERQLAQMPGDQWRDTKPLGTVIKALNDTGETIPWYGVVELDYPGHSRIGVDTYAIYPNVDDFKNQIYFRVKKPTLAGMLEVIGIAQEPISPDCVGNVMIDGVTQVKLFLDSPSGPTDNGMGFGFASPLYNDVDKLEANMNGHIQVIWRTSIYGTYWAIVRLSAIRQRRMVAEAVYDWVENGTYPNGDPRVYCIDKKGPMDFTNAFYVYLPRDRSGNTAGADPAVYTGDEIYYEFDTTGKIVCVSEYLHMGKIKDIRIQGVEGRIPTGWLECDGSSQTGNAGTFNLHDFASTQQPVGGEAKVVARMARHISAAEPMASQNEIDLIDGLGEPGGVVVVPVAGDADDSGGDHFAVEMGAYPTCAVMYIQRYK